MKMSIQKERLGHSKRNIISVLLINTNNTCISKMKPSVEVTHAFQVGNTHSGTQALLKAVTLNCVKKDVYKSVFQ